LLACGSVGYWLIPSDNTVLFSFGAVLAFMAGWGWVGAFHYTVVTWYRAAPAAATGFVSTGLNLGSGLGPLTFGLIAQHLGYRTAWYGAGMVSLLAAITVVAARRHLRARRRPITQTDDPDG
jgi:predicted MFS family arabinose efflux permease